MKCCICGTVRNCGKYLDKIFKNMERIGTLFADYAIILYYDESNDNTLQKLNEYQQKNSKLILHINTEPLLDYRTHRIAKGRNKCLDIMKENYNDYEYFIMMDCDDRCSYNIKLRLMKYYLKRNDWDALSFKHPAGYYDSWALSKRPFVLSCHHFKDHGVGVRFINKIIQKTPKNSLIKCLSAFNGFSIYRKNKFDNCHYDGTFRLDYIPPVLIKENILCSGNINTNRDNQDCEHRFFHITAAIKNNARIRISPLCIFS
jgi:hypothetical protein